MYDEKFGDRREDIDALAKIIANSRRRFTIRYLADHSPTQLRDITDAIAESEYSDDCDQNLADTRQSVYINLYQEHITRLDAANVVDYDDRSKEVAQGPRHDRALRILECIETAGLN